MLRHALAIAALSLPATALVAAAPMSAATYVMKAGAGDQYEIQSSRLVMGTRNPELKQFADKMIADHTKSTADVKAAAMKAGLHPAPPKMDAMGMRNIAALRKVSGTARDRLYLQQQKASHQMALTLHQNYASDGRVAPLSMAASHIAPVVQSHIEMLQSM